MKNNLFILFFLVIYSCSILKKKQFNINFSSLYKEDFLTLSINDSIYYNKTNISTNSTLGIDLKNYLSVKSEIIKLSIKFHSIIEKNFNLERIVELDTILNIKNGSNIIIFAGYDKIKIEQQNKIFILE